MDSIILTKKAVYAVHKENRERFKCINSTADLNVVRSDIEDALLFKMNQYISFQLAEAQEVTLYFQYYATWWDFFKATYFPERLLRRFPVRTKEAAKTITVERGVVYPQLVVPGYEYYPATFIKCPSYHEAEILND